MIDLLVLIRDFDAHHDGLPPLMPFPLPWFLRTWSWFTRILAPEAPMGARRVAGITKGS